MCTFAGTAHRSAAKSGYIVHIPSLAKVSLLGCTRTKRKLASLSDNTSLEVDDEKPASATTIQQCHALATHVIKGICAALTIEIEQDAFGGRDSGWLTPPGATQQTRLLMTMDSADRWIAALHGSALRSPLAYIRMFDHTTGKFLDRAMKLRMHPDEVIDSMIDMDSSIFDKDPEAAPAGLSTPNSGSQTGTHPK